MKYIFIEIFKFILNFIYLFMKLLPNSNKITFISRQSNKPSIDFMLLSEELSKKYKIVILTRRLEKKPIKKIGYTFHILVQMYHIATSKAVVLDSYCIPIGVLKHKKSLVVIQIWHALGSLKKFGYSILDMEEGSSSKMAECMGMHRNYDFVITSSDLCKKNFAEAFNMPVNKVITLSLPRVDYLTVNKYHNEALNNVYNNYPTLENKRENILYLPTFRKNEKLEINELIKSINYKKYNLIIKLHNGNELIYTDSKEINSEETSKVNSLDFLHVADHIITDYSAVVYEASILNKPLYFYNYDYKTYNNNRGLYIDYEKEMPGLISDDIKKIINEIEKGTGDINKVKKFSDKYIQNKDGNATKYLADFIIKTIENK